MPSRKAPEEEVPEVAQTSLAVAPSALPVFDAAVLLTSLPPGETLESELVRRIIRLFASEASRLVAEIERACGAGACDAALAATHSLKSAGDTVGAVAIGMLACELEAEAHAGNVASLAGYSASLRGELDRFLADLGLQRD